jgi:hypothetical protein
MFCLTCFHWWPIGSRYCGVCQRPFNARLCSKEHANPLWGPQQSCVTCNLPLLQQGVPAIGMAWLAIGLTTLLVLWLGYQILLHLDLLLNVAWKACCWLVSLVLAHLPSWWYRLVETLAAWWISLYLLSHLLPKELGGSFRGWLIRCVRTGFRLAGAGMVLLGKGIASLFQVTIRPAAQKMLERGHKVRTTDDED